MQLVPIAISTIPLRPTRYISDFIPPRRHFTAVPIHLFHLQRENALDRTPPLFKLPLTFIPLTVPSLFSPFPFSSCAHVQNIFCCTHLDSLPISITLLVPSGICSYCDFHLSSVFPHLMLLLTFLIAPMFFLRYCTIYWGLLTLGPYDCHCIGQRPFQICPQYMAADLIHHPQSSSTIGNCKSS